MKKISLILFLTFSIISFSQNKKQKKYFNEANKLLLSSKDNKKNIYGALNYYFSTYLINNKSSIGLSAKNKIDSLKFVFRLNLISKMIGSWELIRPKQTNKKTILEVSNNFIISYTISDGQKENILAEEIQFYEPDLEKIVDIHKLWFIEFYNKELWEYVIKKDILYILKRRNSDGTSIIKHSPVYRNNKEIDLYKDDITFKRIK